MTLEVFAALADPVRMAMIDRLAAGPATVGDLGRPHPLSKPAITKHVAALARAGLIDRRRDGRRVICTLRPEPLRAAERWIHDRHQFWTDALTRLDVHLQENTP